MKIKEGNVEGYTVSQKMFGTRRFAPIAAEFGRISKNQKRTFE